MKYLINILFLGFTLFSISCNDPGSSILFDENFLELDAATTITGQRTFTYLRVNDGVGIPSGFKVNLGARQKDIPVNFSFEVSSESTAIENLHYTIESLSVTIPPRTSVVDLPIIILDDNIDGGEIYSLIIRLFSNDVPVHQYYGEATHLIQVSCPVPNDFMTGNYSINYEDVTAAFGLLTFGPPGTIVSLTNANTGSTFRRSFSFVYLPQGGFGNAPVNLFLELNCERVIPELSGHLRLSCDGTTPITIGPSDEFGIYDLQDASSFTLIFNEFVSNGGCPVPVLKQKVRFTKQ